MRWLFRVVSNSLPAAAAAGYRGEFHVKLDTLHYTTSDQWLNEVSQLTQTTYLTERPDAIMDALFGLQGRRRRMVRCRGLLVVGRT